MLEFERSTRRAGVISLTSLIDVMLCLVIFFMLTTQFTAMESIELSLPTKEAEKARAKAKDKDKDANAMLRIFMSNDGLLFLEQKGEMQEFSSDALRENTAKALQKNPQQRVVILSASGVSVQSLVSMMDVVYQAGGRNLSVAEWKP